MDINYFKYNGKYYGVGTLVKIKDINKQHCGFNSILKFTGYNLNDERYCFRSLYGAWTIYKFSNEEIALYVQEILEEGNLELENKKTIHPQYIEGIVSAWIWYILIMVFALLFKGIENIIITWIVATFIFFRWRHHKINGG